MKNLVLFGLLILLLVAVQFASGKTVDEIIEKHIWAKGGFYKLDEIQHVYMEGMITMMGNSGLIKILKVKNELNPAGHDLQWKITSEEGHSFPPGHLLLLNEAIAIMPIEPDIVAPLTNYVANGNQVILAGKEVVDSNTCYKIKLITKAGKETNYWINASDFLLSQLAFKNNDTTPSPNAVIRIGYSNYKVAEGVLLAHSIEMVMSGLNENAPIEINLNRIEINQPVNETFVKPDNQS
jgi:hypothetical protein